MSNTPNNPDFSPAAKDKITTAVRRVMATPTDAGWNPGPVSAGRVMQGVTLFPVTIGTVDYGVNGNATMTNTYNYGNFTNLITGQVVKDAAGNIIGNQSQSWQRPVGNVTTATNGLAMFYGNGTFQLLNTDSVYQVGTCT